MKIVEGWRSHPQDPQAPTQRVPAPLLREVPGWPRVARGSPHSPLLSKPLISCVFSGHLFLASARPPVPRAWSLHPSTRAAVPTAPRPQRRIPSSRIVFPAQGPRFMLPGNCQLHGSRTPACQHEASFCLRRCGLSKCFSD